VSTGPRERRGRKDWTHRVHRDAHDFCTNLELGRILAAAEDGARKVAADAVRAGERRQAEDGEVAELGVDRVKRCRVDPDEELLGIKAGWRGRREVDEREGRGERRGGVDPRAVRGLVW